MLEINEVLHHVQPLDIIADISKPKWGKMFKKSSPLNNLKAFIKSHKEGFNLSFQFDPYVFSYRKLVLGRTLRKIEFQNKLRHFILEDFFIYQSSLPKFNADVNFLYSKGFTNRKKYRFQLFIPLEKEISLTFFLEEMKFTTDLGYRSRAASGAIMEDETLTFCIIKDNANKHYLVIESRKLQPFEAFNKKAHAIINGLGYLSGYLPGDKGYYFAYTTQKMETPKHFYVRAIRNAIKILPRP